MKNQTVTFFLVLVLLIISCTQKPAKPKLKQVKLTKLHTIEGYPEDADSARCFFSSYDVQADDEGYLYIPDERSGSVKVFDKKGNFYSSISNRGMGPEELENGGTFFINKDTVCVFDSLVKLKKFLRTGKYVSTKIFKTELLFLPLSFNVLNDSTLLGRTNTFSRKDKYVEVSMDISLFDHNIKKNKFLTGTKIKYPNEAYKLAIYNPVCSSNDDRIFISQASKSEYKVRVYSHEGEFIKNITQNYAKQKYSKKEMNVLLSKGPKGDHFDELFDYKICILDLMNDKYGNLWVQRDNGTLGEDISFDIFHDDRIISRFSIEHDGTKEFEKIVYLKNYLYLIDLYSNNIEVYDYKIE